jgi:uncharacterized protein (TIGR02285 family)
MGAWRFIGLIIVGFAPAQLLMAQAAASLHILYEIRPPYVIKEGKEIRGLVATPLMNALKELAIPFRLVEKPSKRHLHEIKANHGRVCALGWFKNPDRDRYARFSMPLYQDRPMAILMRRDSAIMHPIHLDSLLQNRAWVRLAKLGYSYGPTIDKKIRYYKTKTRTVGADNITMMSMIAKKRADYMFVSQEEVESLLPSHPQGERLAVVTIDGMPEGNHRHLICSKSVTQTFLDRINQELKAGK